MKSLSAMRLKDILDIYLNLVKKFVAAPNVKPAVGIDIGSSVCKLAELKFSSSGIELVNWAIEPILNGDRKQALRNLLTKLTVPTTSVFTAVYGKGTLVRYLDMPRMNLEDLKRSFAFEVDKYFPFPKDQIFTDCVILNAKEKENKILVLSAAAKKEMITQRMELLKELGLEADFVTLNAMAITNVFQAGQAKNGSGPTGTAPVGKSASVAVLDIGERVSNLTILVNNEPRFTRDIFIGGNELTMCISNALSLDFKAAEELKCAPAARGEEVLRACESTLLNLISEIRLSFDYFLTEKNIPISELFLTGGGSLVEGLPEFFTKYLEMTVSRWDPLANIQVAGNLPVDMVKKNANRLGICLGLALAQA